MEASTNIPGGAAPAAPPAGASAAQAAFREQMMGPQTGGMNLAALRTRAEELRSSIDRIIHTLQFAADRVQWADALEQFTVINVQYQYLLDQLRPLLKHWVVYPKSVNQSNAHVLPIMLATKLLPEMEAEQDALLEQQKTALEGQTPYIALTAQTNSFNDAIDALTQHSQQASGLLDPKGPRRKALTAAASKAAAAAAPAAAPSAAPAAAAAAAPQRPGMPPGARPGMPAGPPKPLEGADKLLAAVGYGAGL